MLVTLAELSKIEILVTVDDALSGCMAKKGSREDEHRPP